MKRTHSILAVFIFLVIFSCGKSFLDYTPNGVVSSSDLNSPEGIEGLVTAAYGSLSNDFFLEQQWSIPWAFGSVRADDAYKGGGGTGDNYDQHMMETFNLLTPSGVGEVNGAWKYAYQNISRCNEALRRMDNITEAEFPNLKERQAECRFLRAHWHFMLKIYYKYPVWVDNTLPKNELNTLSNRLYSNDELWDKIADDFQFAVDNLPEVQDQVGRASKVAAWAYLAKVRLFQAYEQDEQNNVTNINAARLQEVVDLCDNVINSGKHSLNADFAENFLCGFDNSPESVFAVQFSKDDGTTNGKIQFATGVCYNMATQYGCCDFLNPTYSMCNAYKTDPTTGLPMFDTYNDTYLYDMDKWWSTSDLSTLDFMTQTVDPRLDHTVGLPTHPWKYDPNFVMTKSWRRVPETYGYTTSMKSLEHYASSCFKKVGPFMGTSRNADIIRYDEVLLWKAEALIELGRQNEALPLINMIRTRAANSTGRLVKADGTPTANYKIETYQDGVNCTWTQDFARQAVRWEDRLEFCTEGRRFFDLVRWGIAAETLNPFFEHEKILFSFLDNAHFTKGRDEYLPIPQQQIDFTQGLYTQNNGW
jgi:hypothetical protein